MPITRQVKLIKEKEFVVVALDRDDEIFVIYVLSLIGYDIHLFHWASIVSLKTNEISIAVPTQYTDFVDVSSPELAAKLLEYIEINYYTIELIDDK